MQNTTVELMESAMYCSPSLECGYNVRKKPCNLRTSDALLRTVLEKGVSCMFQLSVMEKMKRLTETNSNQPVTEHRQSMVSL